MLFNPGPLMIFMVNTLEVSALLRPDAKISHLVTDASRHIAWAEGDATVCMTVLNDEGAFEPNTVIAHGHRVTGLLYHMGHLVVSDESLGCTFYDAQGEAVEVHSLEAGVLSMETWRHRVGVIDGLGHVHVLQRGHESVALSERLQLGECNAIAASDDTLYIACHDGSLVQANDSTVLWRRPIRGEHGEQITAMGVSHRGVLFLTREGHALVGGDEEAIEFEGWLNGELLVRTDMKARLRTSYTTSDVTCLGFDDGTVHFLQDDGSLTHGLSTGHPIRALIHHEGHVLAGSWFYINGLDADGRSWTVEHQGMPAHFGMLANGVVVFAGDDQNDYTAPEPVGRINLLAELHDVDPSELTMWFEAPNAPVAASAEELYGADAGEEVLHLLTSDEQVAYNQGGPVDETMGDLLADLESDDDAFAPEAPPLLEEEDLLGPALDGTLDAAMEPSDDLLTTLTSQHAVFEAPQANAGDDQELVTGPGGSVAVHLDGRATLDPHDQIRAWSWTDASGRELANTPLLQLNLPVGAFGFDLKVLDANGTWTTDRVSVVVKSGSTS